MAVQIVQLQRELVSCAWCYLYRQLKLSRNFCCNWIIRFDIYKLKISLIISLNKVNRKFALDFRLSPRTEYSKLSLG